MKTVAPDYYSEFTCIADKCSHNCCIGWEIDIDGETLEYYKSVSGGLDNRLKNSIAFTADEPHFILAEGDRCPFLNSKNLCDIITELGEDGLCQICSDHPRYRNFFDGRVEVGLGLCCEAASRLILSRIEKTSLTVIETDAGEQEEDDGFFSWREGLLGIIQNREKSFDERVEEIISSYDISFPQKTLSHWADIYLSLERLDPKWTELLNGLKTKDAIPDSDSIACEQLLYYFIYRHTADGLYDGRLKERVAFRCWEST